MMTFDRVKNKLNANLEYLLEYFAINIPTHLVYRLKIEIFNKTYLVIDNGENPLVIKWHCSWDCDRDLFPCDKLYGNHSFRDIVQQGINVAIKDANK